MKKFTIKGADGARSVNVADQRGLQAVALNPPLTGARSSWRCWTSSRRRRRGHPVCITDIVFYSGGKAAQRHLARRRS